MTTLFKDLMAIDWQVWRGPALAAVRIVGILVAASVGITVLQRAVRGVRVRVANRIGGVDAARRAETLGRMTARSSCAAASRSSRWNNGTCGASSCAA